ncbi:ATP-binding protein [Streptomyces sp. bgisy100]|uniref:ATP-binding protein n=1 Tax=Streptomyces sp. bgisy100 TaxID=3413783 RepID=UPI003D70E9EB
MRTAVADVPHSYTLYCPPLCTSPLVARDFVATVLRSERLDHLVDTAMLCTSELVTNAYLHARGLGSLLWLAIEAADVRVTVYDGTAEPVTRRPATADGESGRGLHLVDVLTHGRWGTALGAPMGLGGAQGKGVWFTLPVAVAPVPV